MMQMPERIFHLADIEPKKFDAITYFEKHPGKDLLYDIPTKLKTKEMILQVLIKEPSNLDYEPFFVDPILKPKLTPRRLLDYELCLLACEKNGGNLTYVPDRYIDYEICKAAVHSYPRILWKVPDRFIDYELLEAAVTCPTDWCCDGLAAVLKDERHDRAENQKLAMMAIEVNPLSLKLFPTEWKSDEVIRRAISSTCGYKESAYLLSDSTRVNPDGGVRNFLAENTLAQDCGSSLFPEADQTMQKEILHDKQALHRRLYSIPTSSIKINGKRINYFNFLSSLEYVGCNRALERMMPRIDMDKIENIILDTPGIDQAEKEFYTGILKARKENILDYSANQLSREKGAMTLTKELKRTVDRSLAAKEISSTEAAKKYSEVQNSQSGKDEILNEPNVKAADGSHFKGSSDNACL